MTTIRSSRPSHETLISVLEAATTPDAIAWLQDGIRGLASAEADRSDTLATWSAGALRRLGREPLGHPDPLPTPCGPLALDLWRRGDAGRACLLLAATADGAPGWAQRVEGLFRHGDEEERIAVVRTLCLLPEPCHLETIALEAGRANSLRLFGALALDHPYPSACYEDHMFNQLVLKCLFTGLPVERIAGLPRRANPELTRMCADYVGERVAAGRSVPPDIWLALEPHADAAGIGLILSYLDHYDPRHRHYAALALSRRQAEPAIAAALATRRGREPDPAVLDALQASAD
jgi:hypothetical protein